MAEYYIDTFQDYLEGLCEVHKLVQHNVAGIRSFASFASDEEVQQLATNAGPNIVVVSHYSGRSFGESDAQQMRTTVGIRFASKSLSYNTADIEAALLTSWNIMWDFISRWRKDVHDDSCGALRGIELQNLNWDEIPDQPFLENHYGWELQVNFKSIQPQYDAAHWI
jgi:hypothetical protein